ncbi:ribonuclease III [Pediococcus claussenii]|uniref:Ribonuclease 3 n=1 Tax=Pediococcus claussenii (strain ATCC BAA-344 / DSM 14800 / JCM 18046 / KCTC 3811 / LMG 21948 / P06) TaxID=701521 RepID=G8PDH1_PEDCP|nr:ribonuclease III [Pediococcus claussenii]AEV95306.1 ribonuclease III [Pediococcus claussenii ATCC BAA-344]ANZ68841.1 ribonuclease III [Pediococcus claussenii]ANZ70657.1 ribonuclease III [Pediococcus claussenii]KRN19512.1 rnc protein [Pediococcus claussenii]
MIKALEDDLAQNFNIHFNNHDLLDEAFTQASYVNEHPNQGLKFYERIEFLGDAVLQIVVSEYLFKRYPEMPQGKLTRLRAAMVKEDSFSDFAKECHFDRYIRLGKGEELSGARQRSSLLCDIFESFTGALYLDQGRDAVEEFVQKVIFPKLDEGRFDHVIDHKSELQEVLQVHGDVDIDYQLIAETGGENDRVFEVELIADGKKLSRGKGTSKKLAEQNAANKALQQIKSKK